ncbi:MAG: alkene reductase [Rhizobacter sp.]|nr:alkene reductase [Rhizobacter sp.]
MATLYDPLRIGDLELPNRVVMAPLTRLRAPGAIPYALMAQYYRQRASAGLIISEATPVSQQGVGYTHVPGMWTREQMQGWRGVTQAVHDAGGRIFQQIWHVGRVSDPSFQEGGAAPVAPSAIAPDGFVSLLRPKRAYVVPRALRLDELPGIVESFRVGAELAQDAGFDGVEIHGANGYLLDQFLQDGSNHREDDYGGSVAHRARLLLEVTDAATSVWGPGRVGVHLAPRGPSHSMGDSNPSATFGHVVRELRRREVGFIFVRESLGADSIGPQLRREFGGVYVANEAFTRESAEKIVADGGADAVAFGAAFIGNPDLPARLKAGAALNPSEPKTFYGPLDDDAAGYIDYPSLAEIQ